MKGLWTPSLYNLSLSYLSISNASLSKPSVWLPLETLRLGFLVNLNLKTYSIAQQIFVGKERKSGTKSRGVSHFVPLRRFYAVLFVPLFCRLRDIVKNDPTA